MELKERVIEKLEEAMMLSEVANECRVTLGYGVVEDILALLKAQEPVEPKLDVDEWRCGNCGHKLEHQELLGDNVLFHEQYNYCPNCGQEVKWE